MAVADTVVALAADIPSLVAPEWACLVGLEWECAALSWQVRWDGCQCSASVTRDFNRNDRFGRFNRFNDRDFDRDDRFHRFDHFNQVIFIGDFGFPWWWGWGWDPWWGWNWGYPYGYYGGYDYGGYGAGYGYGDSSQSRVAELQRRLAQARYYHGAIDGILGPATRRAIRAYERDHGYVG